MNTTNTTSKYDHAAFPGSPWEQGRLRELSLAEGLARLAERFGLTFESARYTTSLGEFDLALTAGQVYGAEFAGLLSRHAPRTGIRPTRHLHPRNSWCKMSHFDVQRMLDEAGV